MSDDLFDMVNIEALIKKCIELYDLKPNRILKSQSGYRSLIIPIELSDNKFVCLLLYKNEPGILKQIKVANNYSDFLFNQNMPVRSLADHRIIKVNSNQYSFACLYNYLPGITISWESYTMDHIKLLGKTLAMMHHESVKLDLPGIEDIELINDKLINKMNIYFQDSGVIKALNNKLNLSLPKTNLNISFQNVYAKTPKQVLHMDFVRGNILFGEPLKKPDIYQEGIARISGIIDFEKVAYGSIYYDVARTLTFLLVDCKYKTTEKVYKYFIKSGYEKRGGGKIEDLSLLDRLVSFYLVYDFYKFLKHNPYEDLDMNEHFIRTRDLLVERKVLQCV